MPPTPEHASLDEAYRLQSSPTPPSLEELLERFPEVASDPQAVLDLIYHEIMITEEAGGTIHWGTYRERFPHLADGLRDLEAVHQALDSASGNTQDPAIQTTGHSGLRSKPSGTAAADSGEPRFRILRPHASGGVGVVFVAEDRQLGREVALKEIRDDFAADPGVKDRFLREARITGRLEHPGIVPVYALGQADDGRPYYAMRLISGNPLSVVLSGSGRMGAGAVRDQRAFDSLEFRGLLQRLVQVCQTMSYAHTRGVIHRDLKPANIMLGEFGETLIVDWGLARELRDVAALDTADSSGDTAPSDCTATRTGQLAGTPAYMSPEQASGRNCELTATTDIYSLGAILRTLLTGTHPFAHVGSSVKDVLKEAAVGSWKPVRAVVPGAPRGLAAISEKAMALKPEDRYATAADLAADLERWLADRAVTARRDTWLESTGRIFRRHRGVVVTGALAAVVIAVGSGFAALKFRSERDFSSALAKRNDGLVTQTSVAIEEMGTQLARSVISSGGGVVEYQLAEDAMRIGVEHLLPLANEYTNEKLRFALITMREKLAIMAMTTGKFDVAFADTEGLLEDAQQLARDFPTLENRLKVGGIVRIRADAANYLGRPDLALQLIQEQVERDRAVYREATGSTEPARRLCERLTTLVQIGLQHHQQKPTAVLIPLDVLSASLDEMESIVARLPSEEVNSGPLSYVPLWLEQNRSELAVVVYRAAARKGPPEMAREVAKQTDAILNRATQFLLEACRTHPDSYPKRNTLTVHLDLQENFLWESGLQSYADILRWKLTVVDEMVRLAPKDPSLHVALRRIRNLLAGDLLWLRIGESAGGNVASDATDPEVESLIAANLAAFPTTTWTLDDGQNRDAQLSRIDTLRLKAIWKVVRGDSTDIASLIDGSEQLADGLPGDPVAMERRAMIVLALEASTFPLDAIDKLFGKLQPRIQSDITTFVRGGQPLPNSLVMQRWLRTAAGIKWLESTYGSESAPPPPPLPVDLTPPG